MTETRTAVITGILTPVIISIITISTNSAILHAEFFTDFDVNPRTVEPGEETSIYVSNEGQIQANNAILTLYANNTIDSFRDICPEGSMYRLDNKTLVVEFQKMTPLMVCEFRLTASEPVQFYMVAITSDNRSLWAPDVLSTSPFLQSIVKSSLLAILVIEGIIIVLLARWKISGAIVSLEFWIRRNKFQKTSRIAKTRKFVLDEYGVQIDEVDATILELVHYKKQTMNQLKKYSGLTMWQVKYRVWKMRRRELMLKETLNLNTTLSSYFGS